MNMDKKLDIFFFINLVFEHKIFCKAIKVGQNMTCIGFKPQWVDAHGNNFLTIKAEILCVLSLGESCTFHHQLNWTTRSNVSDLVVLFAGCHSP